MKPARTVHKESSRIADVTRFARRTEMRDRKILLATDFSDHIEPLLRHAACFARDLEAMLLVVHVDDGRPDEAPSWRVSAKERLEAVAASATDIPIEHHLLHGTPAREITRFAKENDVELIMMGTHGRTGLDRVLQGSVAEGVAHMASCPVLTYRVPPNARIEQPTGTPMTVTARPLSHYSNNRGMELLCRAVAARATDIHIDSSEDDVTVRFRIDGKIEQYCRYDLDTGQTVINQLRVLADLDVPDPFHPRESRLQLPDPYRHINVRMTVSRSDSGDAMALRLLDRERLIRPFKSLGFGTDQQEEFDRVMTGGTGLVLVTGPTGSGKTTTLYSILNSLDDGSRCIVSIEDPVEFAIPTYRQLNVDTRHDVTMASGMRTILRMDPDIVLFGEIRDTETAEIAMRAASSGRQVFSSLHTRDVASTITALRDLGVDDRSTASNLKGIVCQRLVRCLCNKCANRSAPSDAEIQVFADNGVDVPGEVGRPVGCSECRKTGYHGRIGVFEVAAVSDELGNAIAGHASESELGTILRNGEIRSVVTDGLNKVADGVTSVQEVLSMVWSAPLHQDA